MSCYHPLKAWRDHAGVKILSADEPLFNMHLPCGRCVGCRLERSRQWAIRCVHEAQMHQENSFITLTYNDERIPDDHGLRHRDWQLFMKKLRKKNAGRTIRYYMCGEYGPNGGRPHYHACLFGKQFGDLKLMGKSEAGEIIYSSEELTEIWGNGHTSVGELTFKSAAYVARYIMDKQDGEMGRRKYQVVSEITGEIINREPEYNKGSLKPGIGATWYAKYKTDIYPHDHAIINGKAIRPPKAYDRILKRENLEQYNLIKEKRKIAVWGNKNNNTPERLKAREEVAKARVKNKLRTLK